MKSLSNEHLVASLESRDDTTFGKGMKRMIPLNFLTLTMVVYAQSIGTPNSIAALSLAGIVPTGDTQGKGRLFPSHGYALLGAGVGLQVHTFIAPYLSLTMRVSQHFIPLDAKALGKRNSLFPEPVSIEKNPTLSQTVAALGIGSGIQIDWIALYVPLQFALGLYSLPEIEGRKSATQSWMQPKFSTVQVGLSTGLLASFFITDDFFAGLSLLFTRVRSGEKTFERTRYDNGRPTQTFIHKSPISTELSEAGIVVGLSF